MQAHVPLTDSQTQIRLYNGSKCRFSDDDFVEFCRLNLDLRAELTAQGEIIITPPAGGESSSRNAGLTMQLRSWTMTDGSGQAFDSSAGFHLPDGSTLSPDAAWVSNEALCRLAPKQRKQFLPLCPEFVVEILSPSDNLSDARKKMELWIVNGAQLAWLIDGDARTVYVYQPHRRPKTLRGAAQLAGEGPVSGFLLKAASIWRGLA